MCGLGYHGFTSSALANWASGPRKGADLLELISPQPPRCTAWQDLAKRCCDLFRVEDLLTKDPRIIHSRKERTELEGLTWNKNRLLAYSPGPMGCYKKIIEMPLSLSSTR